jgi:hypothetical protein
MGEKEAALKELEQAMGMEVEDINAHLQKVMNDILSMSCNAVALLWLSVACQAKIAFDIPVTSGLLKILLFCKLCFNAQPSSKLGGMVCIMTMAARLASVCKVLELSTAERLAQHVVFSSGALLLCRLMQSSF